MLASAVDMDFQVLGPLEVHREGGQLALGPAKQRAVLAILLVRANELVSSDRLIEELWPEPPETAANALQVYVAQAPQGARARADRAGRRASSWSPARRVPACASSPTQLDADRFERLLGEGRAAAAARDPATAAAQLRQALDLWRGPALADFAYDPFAQAEIARLEELRLDAIEDRIEADLALGGAADLIGELEALISDNPLRERLRGQLMLALYRVGPPGGRARGLQRHAPDPRRRARAGAEPTATAPAGRDSPPGAGARGLDRTAGAGPSRRRRRPTTPAPELRKTVTVLIARRPSARGLDPEALSHAEQALPRPPRPYRGTLRRSGREQPR